MGAEAKEELYAVHERDLERFLKSLGLLEALKKGEIRCDICSCLVTKENLGFIYPFEGKTRVCCDRPDCYHEIMRKVKGE